MCTNHFSVCISPVYNDFCFFPQHRNIIVIQTYILACNSYHEAV